MGVIERIISAIFGGNRNLIKETAEVFRENAEAGAGREHLVQIQAMEQLGREFAQVRVGWFDRLMDGLNRVPRPAMALGTLGLFVAAMVDPVWFSSRMQGIALVPEPLWWLLGVIVSFYFGARHQIKSHQFQRDIAQTMARVPQVVQNIQDIERLRSDSPGAAATGPNASLTMEAVEPGTNPALDEWRRVA